MSNPADSDCLIAATPPDQTGAPDEGDANARGELLAEVDLKWLMAGHGQWIDPLRLHCDPLYAAEVLH